MPDLLNETAHVDTKTKLRIAKLINARELREKLAPEFEAAKAAVKERKEKEFLTLQDIADILGVHKSTIMRWIARGTGPKVSKVSGKAMRTVRTSDFEEWTESCKVPVRTVC